MKNNLKKSFLKTKTPVLVGVSLVFLIITIAVISIIHISKAREVEFLSAKDNFKVDENLVFRFKYRGNGESSNLNIKVIVFDYKGEEVTQLNPDGHYKNGEISVDLTEYFHNVKPGKYSLKFEIEDKNNGKTYVENKDFTWGVLAINTNKSIYLPNEQAYLQMAVLKDDGHTICDANLKLEITSPHGGQSSVTVQKSGECGPDNVTDAPDYFAYYEIPDRVGAYEMKLTNLDNGYEIEDSFEVRESVPFDIERIGPTRIYPPADYQMILRVKVNQDFTGEVIETIPESFVIKSQIPNSKSQTNTKYQIPNTKYIVWRVDWKAGESYELKYQFDAPDVSPYLYLLGPLEFSVVSCGEANVSCGLVFKELRSWQIAADAPGTIFFDDYETGNHNNWTNTTVSGTGVAEVLPTNPYLGTYAGHYYRTSASDAADVGFAYKDFTAPAGNNVWAKGYFRFDSIPSSTYGTVNSVLSLSTTDTAQTKARFHAYNNNVLRCSYRKKDNTNYTSDWGTSLTTGVYYALKINFDNSGDNPVITWYVNGTQICTYTDTTSGTAYTPTRVKAGSSLDTGLATNPDNYYTGTADTRADNVGVYDSDPDYTPPVTSFLRMKGGTRIKGGVRLK